MRCFLRSFSVELTGDSVIPHLGEFLRPIVHCTELETIDIWAHKIESFAGRELDRRLDEGAEVACMELPCLSDPDDGIPF